MKNKLQFTEKNKEEEEKKNSKPKSKTQKIFLLIQDYCKENLDSNSNNSLPSIIKELQNWLNETQNTSDEAKSDEQLAIILIENYLKPIENEASLLMKIALADIFKKSELEKILSKDFFNPIEKKQFEDNYLKSILATKPKIIQSSNSTFFMQNTNFDIQKIILLDRPSLELIKISTTSKLFYHCINDILFERDDEIALNFQEKSIENLIN